LSAFSNGSAGSTVLRRIHLFAARLAIIAMLIDALLPTAVSAAARFDATAGSLPLCSAAGTPHPTKEAPALPMRHCALCAAGAACVAGLLPSRQGDGFAGRFLVGFARPKPALLTQTVRNIFYDTAQPRAPPTAFS
jgi:hypothetical protein